MFRVAVMGGIGSGKTAVTDYLARRGAVVVDADVVAREVVRPGQPAWQQLRDAFGDAILAPDSTIDRPFLAEIVFHDASALRRLNQITHGAIGLEMLRLLELAGAAELIAVALPLYRPFHKELLSLNEAWCVYVEPEVALARLTGPRGLSESDARARLAAQTSNEDRIALADVVLHNSGTLDQLHDAVDAVLIERGLLSE